MMDTQRQHVSLSGETDLCSVCGDQVAGKYFGAYVCMPCKIFFLRNHDKSDVLTCSGIASNGMCTINKSTRTNCSSCRYKKCINVGMAKKERPEVVQPLQGQKLCMVCSDIANGIHFGVVSCEGCKKFFRRSIGEQDKYKCRGQKQCSINPRSRNTCRYCRYQKCLKVGMSPDVGSKKDNDNPSSNSEWRRKPSKELPSPLTTTSYNTVVATNTSSTFPKEGRPNNQTLQGYSTSASSWANMPPLTTMSESHMHHLAMMNLSQRTPPAQFLEKNVAHEQNTQPYRGMLPVSSQQFAIREEMNLLQDHRNQANNSSPEILPENNIAKTMRLQHHNMAGTTASYDDENFMPSEIKPFSFDTGRDRSHSISPASSASIPEFEISDTRPHQGYKTKRRYSISSQEYKSDEEFKCLSPSKILKSEHSPTQFSCRYTNKTLADIAGNIMMSEEEVKEIYAPIMKECLSIFRPFEFTKTVINKTVSWMQSFNKTKTDLSWLENLLNIENTDFVCSFAVLDDLLKYFTVDNHPKELEDINHFFTDLYKMVIIDVECSSLPEHEKMVHSKMLINLNGADYVRNGNRSSDGRPQKCCENSRAAQSSDQQFTKLMDLIKQYSSTSNSDTKLDILWGICPSFYKSKYWLQPTFPTENLSLTDSCKMTIRAVARSLQQYTFSFIWDRLMLYQQYSGEKRTAQDYGRNDVYKFLMEYLDKQATAMAGFVSELPEWKNLEKQDQLQILYKMMPLRIMCMSLYMFLPNCEDGKMLHPICWDWYTWPWMEFLQAFKDMAEEQIAQEIDLIEASLTLVLAGIASDTTLVKSPEKVEKVREPFLKALIAYLQRKHGSRWKETLKNLFKFVPKMRVLYAWFGAIWQNIILRMSG